MVLPIDARGATAQARATSRGRRVAEILGAEICQPVTCNDGRSDEEMIGASYDAIETYLRLRELGRAAQNDAIDRRHSKNAHRYAVGSSAIHLDVMPRGVPGEGQMKSCQGARNDRRPWALPPLTHWDGPGERVIIRADVAYEAVPDGRV